MRFGVCGCLNSDEAPPKNFSDHGGRIARAINAKIRELVGGQALGVEGTEAGLVAEKGPARHGHAAREKYVDGGVQPDDGYAEVAQEFGSARLGVRAATEGKNRRFFELGGATDRSAQLLRFQLAKRGFAMALKEFRDAYTGCLFDAFVQIDEMPAELAGQAGADRAFARAHETSQANHLGTGLRAPSDEGLSHNSGGAD